MDYGTPEKKMDVVIQDNPGTVTIDVPENMPQSGATTIGIPEIKPVEAITEPIISEANRAQSIEQPQVEQKEIENSMKENPVSEAIKQDKNRIPNPEGKGGFQDHPELINRNGRPKRDWTWKALLEELAEEDQTFKDKDGNKVVLKWKRAVAKKLYQAATAGNVHAIRELMNRMDGMPQQDITSGGEKLEGVQIYRPEKYKE